MKKRLWVLHPLLLASTLPALAAQSDEDSIIVSANRTHRTVAEMAQTTWVIEGQEIEQQVQGGKEFKDVLALFEGTGLPLIVEVKSFRDNFAELTERTMAELDRFTVEYCVESFDPRCVAWLRTHRPDVIRGQLSCNFLKDRGNLSLPMAFATTNLLGNITAQPDFIAYKFEDKKNWAPRLCRKLYGAQGVYWTIRSREDMETAEREGAIAIFERFIP